MMRRIAFCFLMAAAAVSAAGCSALSQTPSVPVRHPEDLAAGRVDCLECHQDVSTGALKPYATFTHSRVFIDRHGFYARQSQLLCASCHGPSFCQTCHARKEELLPSVREGDRPDLKLPHRGDYALQHRIDGRLDPGSCFPCHGNKISGSCRPCHR